jgi:perosamine synthetase
VRDALLPYATQAVDDADVAAVVEVLRGAWLTTGPKVTAFERAVADAVGAADAVSFSSGTAALHGAAYAAGLAEGDEAVTTPMTFCATANSLLYVGARPVFADVEPESLNLDPAEVEARLTPATKAVVAVDYAGQPARLDELAALAHDRGALLIEDACHALGARIGQRPVGNVADLTVFSFHPVKHVAAGEGGMVAVEDPELARRLRLFRNHGITSDFRQREHAGSWFYEMVDLGFNYRLTDIQSALGLSQLAKLEPWLARRREIAARYDEAFAELPLRTLSPRAGVEHAYHLYVVLLDLEALSVGRTEIFAALRAEGIGVNVHYVPVHLHPYYRERLGTGPGMLPVAEDAYERMVTLPLFPAMSDDDAADVVDAVRKVLGAYAA